LIEKTRIVQYSAAKDIGLILAILSRETGPIGYRYYKYLKLNPSRKFVTSGADVHKNGIAGFDFMMGGNQAAFHRKNFKDAGISITSVKKSELKQGKSNRAPGRIQVKHFLFAAFSMLAYCEKRLKVRLNATVFDAMDLKAKRVWIALYFALPGGVLKLKSKIDDIASDDRIMGKYGRLILKKETPPPNSRGTLTRARGIALKADIFETTCNNMFEQGFNALSNLFN
jgi:hypothetical protein